MTDTLCIDYVFYFILKKATNDGYCIICEKSKIPIADIQSIIYGFFPTADVQYIVCGYFTFPTIIFGAN